MIVYFGKFLKTLYFQKMMFMHLASYTKRLGQVVVFLHCSSGLVSLLACDTRPNAVLKSPAIRLCVEEHGVVAKYKSKMAHSWLCVGPNYFGVVRTRGLEHAKSARLHRMRDFVTFPMLA